jgi:glutamate N-acetyltransferase/amino-acid N-acetyltransferase
MAVGKTTIGALLTIPGIKLATICAGVKTQGRKDLVLIELNKQATVAGVFTQNAFCAAPVQLAKQHLSLDTPRYFLINTGYAYASTGQAGYEDAICCCHAVAEVTDSKITEILPFSTGVIGERLPVDKITQAIPGAYSALDYDAWLVAAEGIMTTDTRPKALSTSSECQGRRIHITGIAKGAGMIKPNMATMLGFIFTDAAIEHALLDPLLRSAVQQSFNRITVDGDTSTNDACMLVATGESGVAIAPENEDFNTFSHALNSVFVGLAQALIRDAEGANKFITIHVLQGANSEECLQIAYAVAESPLVKTALFASDPNVGRLMMAVGRSGPQEMDAKKVSISLGDLCIVENGAIAKSYNEQQVAPLMAKEEIEITITLGRGSAVESVWTSDLSHEYIRINAEQRT